MTRSHPGGVRRVGAPKTARTSALCALLALSLFSALAMVLAHPGTARDMNGATGHVHDVPAAPDAPPGEQDHRGDVGADERSGQRSGALISAGGPLDPSHDDDGAAHHHHHGDTDAGVLFSLALPSPSEDHHPRPRTATPLPAWTSNGTDRPD